jgi:hypothetical protein
MLRPDISDCVENWTGASRKLKELTTSISQMVDKATFTRRVWTNETMQNACAILKVRASHITNK